MKKLGLALAVIVLLLGLASCRSETQNRIRRNIQEFTGQRMYITLYSLNGNVVFEGVVDGKVTRSTSQSATGKDRTATGSYIFWYDDKGRYHQTDLPYLLTSYQR